MPAYARTLYCTGAPARGGLGLGKAGVAGEGGAAPFGLRASGFFALSIARAESPAFLLLGVMDGFGASVAPVLPASGLAGGGLSGRTGGEAAEKGAAAALPLCGLAERGLSACDCAGWLGVEGEEEGLVPDFEGGLGFASEDCAGVPPEGVEGSAGDLATAAACKAPPTLAGESPLSAVAGGARSTLGAGGELPCLGGGVVCS